MSFKHIPGLTIAPKTTTPETNVKPKIGRDQLQMLQACGVNSWSSLRSYIQLARQEDAGAQIDASNPSDNGRFRIVTAEDLGFQNGSENRLYEPEIVVRDVILDLSDLQIRDSRAVEFTNCVITGDLIISMSDSILCKVYLDRCLVLGRIVIHNVRSLDCSVVIESTNCFALEIWGSEVESIDISRCRLPGLYLKNVRTDRLSILATQIQYARLCRLSVQVSRIDHEQFDLGNMAKEKAKQYRVPHLPEGFFEIIHDVTFGDTAREELFQTLTVLRQHTALESDRRSLSIVRLIESTQYQRSLWRSLTVRLLGAVQSPSQVLCAAVCVFFGMALAYHLLPLQFAQGQTTRQLDFSTACYFSGVTMMTIGYGDIVPLGAARFLAILQSVLGITVWSMYVIALVRKYID